MRPLYFYFIIFPAVLSLVSCVSTGKFKDMQQQAQKNDSLYTWAMRTLKTCQDDNDNLTKQKTSLQNQVNSQNTLLSASNENTTQLRRQLQDLSAISSAQAESIKNSLDNMSAKDTYIRNLQSALSHRDSVNVAVLMDLKLTLGGFGDQYVNIKLEKGVVSVDLSDSLLFNNDSNSYTLTDKAKSVLGRLARVFDDQPDLEFMVEGHPDIPPADSLNKDSLHSGNLITDSMHGDSLLTGSPLTGSLLTDSLLAHNLPNTSSVSPDNWDLSVKRATAVVWMLQNKYNIAPARMTAAGRSTPDRNTRIVIFPQLDPLLRVLEHKQGQAAPPAPATPSAPAPPATSAAPTPAPVSTPPAPAASSTPPSPPATPPLNS